MSLCDASMQKKKRKRKEKEKEKKKKRKRKLEIESRFDDINGSTFIEGLMNLESN